MLLDQTMMQNVAGESNAIPSGSPLPNTGQRRSSPTTALERGDLGSSIEALPSTSAHLASPFAASPFTSKPYSHLPTPQSPSNFGNYLRTNTNISESPVAHSYQTPSRVLSTPTTQRRLPSVSEDRNSNQPPTQVATPESSPFSQRHNALGPSWQSVTTPKGPSPFPPRDTYASLSMQSSSSTDSSLSQTEGRSSQLSSPFMQKLSIKLPSTSTPSNQPSSARSYHSQTPPPSATDPRGRSSSPTRDGNRSSFPTPNSSQPATPLHRALQAPQTPQQRQPKLPEEMPPPAGGELERIRQAMIQERMAHIQEAETRRPEYLKRNKRTFSESDPFGLEEEEALNQSSREREGVVGIMESPVKGRRLTLFQETSEESFEESLMAGGYGRYRTADWVRQPQPTVLATPGAPGPSSAVAILERAEEIPPSDAELKKRRRLTAFTGKPNQLKARLQPVQLEGMGRVLVDLATQGDVLAAAESSTAKKKAATSKRKKKEAEKRGIVDGSSAENAQDRPNWPDSQFPWRVRLEERDEAEKEREKEKLKWIERFLDREDSDEEDDEEIRLAFSPMEDDPPGGSSSAAGAIRMGRGKMVPLTTNADIRPFARKHTMFPSDPADARTALLSKKSVRTLSYRQQKRQRRRREGGEDEEDEVLCICRGTDDGRELVQCDSCEMWYHLECIGIRDISQLGREEDPWYCRTCEEEGRSPFVEPLEEPMSEPTFVPTDNTPSLKRTNEATFFQPSLQDSPMPWSTTRMPRTPNRGSLSSMGDLYSGSTWIDSSGHGPRTPQRNTYEPRIYSSTPGFPESSRRPSNDTPFDPTSTPSRGIRFGASFATPKNSWSLRGSGPFQTPSRPSGRSSWHRAFGGPGTLTSALDDDHGYYDRMYGNDESPIRRVRPNDGMKARKIMDSPSAPRSLHSVSRSLFEESPVVRFQDVVRRREASQHSNERQRTPS